MVRKIIPVLFLAALCVFPLFAQTRKPSALFFIRENGKYGYIDRAGKVVIPCQFENTMGFNEGLAATKLNGKWPF